MGPTVVLLAVLLAFPVFAEMPVQALPGAASCPVDLPPTGEWTDVEHLTWDQVCRGHWPDLSRLDRASMACNPAHIDGEIPAHRRLSARFLQLVLTHERYTRALAKPQVSISCAHVDGRLELDNEDVIPSFVISRGYMPSGLNLRHARFERGLFLIGSRVGEMNADAAVFSGALFLRSRTTFTGNVALRGAYINSNLETDGSTFEGVFDAENVDVAGNLLLRGGSSFKSDVVLRGAAIGGQLSANGSTFQGTLDAAGSRVGAALLLRNGAEFQRVDLTRAHVGGSLQLDSSTFGGVVDLTGARIGGDMLLSSPFHGVPKWTVDSGLVLRNTTVTALQAEMAAWRVHEETWLSTDLTGFTYQRLGGLFANHETSRTNMADAGANELVAWIEQSQPDHDRRYDPQPYTQLAQALAAAGATTTADRVRYARSDHKRRVASTPKTERAFLTIMKYLIGYGVYPFRTFGCFAVLVLVGVAVSAKSRSSALQSLGARVCYSLGNALPLVELKAVHKHIEHDVLIVEWFFHAQKVLGFALATILVGALTLLSD